MGKRYHCDYCDKTMVATPVIVKTHNKGVVHQKLVQDHYQQHKDPEIILAEESYKNPCSRFLKGFCQFGSICRYSHYTSEQMDAFRDYVARKKQSALNSAYPSIEDLYRKLQNEKSTKTKNTDNTTTVLYDRNGVTHVFPWTYSEILGNHEVNLPPSIKRFKIEDFARASITEWG